MVSKISKGKWYRIADMLGTYDAVCTKGGAKAILVHNRDTLPILSVGGKGKMVIYTIEKKHYGIVTEIPSPLIDDSGMSSKWTVKNYREMEHSRGIAWSLKLYCNGTDVGMVDNEGTGGADNLHHIKRPYDQEFINDAKWFAESYGMSTTFECHTYLLNYLIDGIKKGLTPKQFLALNV